MPHGRTAGNTRTTGLEQCYTPAGVATALCQFLVDAGADTTVTWLEPAAGTGVFVDAFHAAGVRDVVAVDVDPRHPAVGQADFLTVDLDVTGAVCVTNPPFGRNHALSVPFFNRAADDCQLIAFVVPRSWRKWSVVNRLDRRFHKVVDRDLTVAYTGPDGTPLTSSSALRTAFQVWERRDVPRPTFPARTTSSMTRVAPADADVALTVFGHGCGTVRTEFARTPNTTRTFLRAAPEVLAALGAVDLSMFSSQVAYTPALATAEIDVAVGHWLATGEQLPADYLTRSTLVPARTLTVPADEQTGPFPLACGTVPAAVCA